MSKRPKIWDSRIASGLCQYCGINPPEVKPSPRPNQKPSVVCSECKKQRYEKYKNKHYNSKEKQREYHKQVRVAVINKYGGKCTCCGTADWEFLAIDHINHDGAAERRNRLGHNKGGAPHQFYLKLKREPIRTDLQVLCHNCNNSFGFYGYSPACPDCTRPSWKRSTPLSLQ